MSVQQTRSPIPSSIQVAQSTAYVLWSEAQRLVARLEPSRYASDRHKHVFYRAFLRMGRRYWIAESFDREQFPTRDGQVLTREEYIKRLYHKFRFQPNPDLWGRENA